MEMDCETVKVSEAFDQMKSNLASSTNKNNLLRNYQCKIHIGNNPTEYTIETTLFPPEALNVYSAYNLEDDISQIDKEKYFNNHRGGSQGDYRQGMKRKIQNVVDCLTKFPCSKRAVITIPNNPNHCHESDEDSKCMREIHFYLDSSCEGDGDGDHGASVMLLNATVLMRAQAVEIFPKNIHFIASLMNRVATECNLSRAASNSGDYLEEIQPGVLYYLATTLVSVRED